MLEKLTGRYPLPVFLSLTMPWVPHPLRPDAPGSRINEVPQRAGFEADR